MNVVIYTCFHIKNKDSAQPSIMEQVTSCREFAKRNNHTIVGEYYDETHLGSYHGRPVFYRMLGERIDTRFQGILTYSSDRINKNSFFFMFDEARLKEMDIALFTTKSQD